MRRPTPRRAIAPALAAVCMALAPFAQAAQTAPPLDAAARLQVVDAVAREMQLHYVFPPIAQAVDAALHQDLNARAFDHAKTGEEFADALTQRLFALTHDRHVRVMYDAHGLPPRTDAEPSEQEKAEYLKNEQEHAFGFERVERLPFNIGYIDLRGFADATDAGPAITGAMSLVAYTDALIVDLRQNHGGDPAAVSLMLSYLFDKRTHVNDLYYREGDRTEQYWTQDWVPGRRYGGTKPLYVLTSSHTFSGGEEFAYDVKNLKRATLVGETTGGGANPGDFRPLTPHFQMFVPDGRAISPVTHANWEGTGVEPDVKVQADEALTVAQTMALKQMLAAEKDADRKTRLQQRIDELQRAPAVAAAAPAPAH